MKIEENKIMKIECIKGFTDSENLNVICLQGDVAKIIEVEEGVILIEVVEGWQMGCELSLTPKQVTDCFKWVS